VSELTLTEPTGFSAWAARRAVWFLIAIHLPFVVFTPLVTITRRPDAPAGEIALIALGGLAIGGLQFWHSLAAARGGRPRGWPLTFAAMVVLALVPGWWIRADWVLMLWFVIASALMLLPRRPGAVVAAVLVAGGTAWWCVDDVIAGLATWRMALLTPYYLAILVMGSGALFGSARLAAILDKVFAARTEPAEQALSRERLRVSRDLHDLLGQSLSAVSLKGDLAVRLLDADPPAAHREIASLTSVARTALRDMRAVMRDEHDVSMRAEADAAQAVLQAAGITVHVAATLPGIAPALDAVLAWAVREGATNILRHSQASQASIMASREDGLAVLEIVNDGALARVSEEAAEGTGLAGLAERARAAGGTAAGEHLGDGGFRLRVELPEGTS
jgi:two-component system, NarL family, sensor histidine kinase DesK